MQGIRGRTNSLGSSFRAFFNSEKLCDVTFIIQEQKYFAHKLVLAARSPYFNNLILVNCKHSNTLEIEIQDALPHIFLAVLEYMYTDTTLLKQENVWEIFQAAKFYQLSDLCTLCEEFSISTLSEKNVFEHWKRSQGLDAHQTMEHCAGYVKSKFAAELSKANIPLHTVSPVANVDAVMNAVKNLPTPQTQPQAPSKDVVEETSTQAELYTSLSNYSFPLKGAPPQQQAQANGTTTAPAPAAATATQPLKEEDENTVTQTFEYWGNQMPPAAFPTPESMAAFPQFFRVDDKQPVKLEQQQPSTSSTNTTTTTTAANTMAAIAALTPAEKRKKSLLCRRLSVIPQADPSSVAAFFQHMISAVTRLLESERTTLFMYDKESDELCSQVAVGDVEIRIPSHKGIAGSVFKSGKPANISDAYANDKFASEVDKNTGFTTRYVLCSPILGKNNQVVGVIEVLNKYSGPFNDEDEMHLKTAALLLCKFLEDQLDDTNSIPKALSSQVMLLNPSSYHRRKTDDLFSFVFDNVDDISDLLTETGQDNTNLLHQPNNVRSQSPIYASYQNGPNVQAPPVPVTNAQQPLSANVAATATVAAQQAMQPPMPVQQALPQPANTSTMAAAAQRMQPSPSMQQPPQQQQPMVALQPSPSLPINMSPELLQHQMMMQYLSQQQQQQMQQQQQQQHQGIPLEIQQQMQQQQLQQQQLQQQQMQQQNSIAQQWNSVTAQQMQQFTQNLLAAQRPQQQFNFVPQPQGSRKRAHPEGEAIEETETKKRRLNPPKQAQPQQQHPAPTPQPQQQQPQQQGQAKRDAPFMHFRIPRYELQFIQYDGSGKKK